MKERCRGTRANGQPCRQTEGLDKDGLCRYHAPEWNRPPSGMPARAEAHPFEDVVVDVDDGAEEEPAGEEIPLDVRSRLAADAAVFYESRVRSFFDGALAATKSVRVECPSCETKFQAGVPDWTARGNVLRTLLEHGVGRPPANVEGVEGMSAEDVRTIRELAAAREKELHDFTNAELRLIVAHDELQAGEHPYAEQLDGALDELFAAKIMPTAHKGEVSPADLREALERGYDEVVEAARAQRGERDASREARLNGKAA